MQRQRIKSAFSTAHIFHLRQDDLSTGSIFFNNAIHAGAMCDVSPRVITEIPDAAVSWLFIEPVRAAVPGVIR